MSFSRVGLLGLVLQHLLQVTYSYPATYQVLRADDSSKTLKLKTVVGLVDNDALAWGNYTAGNSLEGWNYLEVFGSNQIKSVDDMLLSRKAMGYLEGQASCNEITHFYPNFYNDLFGTESPGAGTIAFIRKNYAWVKDMAEKNWQTDEYWLAQRAMLQQLEGMFEGYRDSTCQQAEPHTFAWNTLSDPRFEQFLLINAWGDLYQITLKFKEPTVSLSRIYGLHSKSNKENPSKKEFSKLERCSGLIKVLPGWSDVLFAHNTWDGYGGLGPRIFKKYSYPITARKSSSNSPSEYIPYTTYFSSSPILLSSVDDFFVLNGRASLGVIETTNSMFNLPLLDLVKPETVLSWQRSTAANMLSSSGSEWAQIFSRYHSGTYTNQWMILDTAMFVPGTAPKTGFFTVLEEVPGLIVYDDMTSVLVEQQFWSSYNSPFFPEIQEASGYAKLCKKGASNACYEKAPRAQLFKQYQSTVIDMPTMEALMQYNNFTADAASDDDSCKAIACRGDLQPIESDAGAFGALDAKIGSVLLAKSASGVAQKTAGTSRESDSGEFSPPIFIHLGPATSSGSLPPFCWAQFDSVSNGHVYSHIGQPECFDFSWFRLQGNAN